MHDQCVCVYNSVHYNFDLLLYNYYNRLKIIRNITHIIIIIIIIIVVVVVVLFVSKI